MDNMNTAQHTMPSLFVSHGSPMLAIDKVLGEKYQQWGKSLNRPRAILVFSAHWQGQALQFGEADMHQKLIYDFYGFPEYLYQLQYPAPAAPWLIAQIQALLAQPPGLRQRGLDHGVWIPLLHMWPQADIPVLQMSMPFHYTDQMLYELGQRLAPLRQQGVLIIGSGMLTHNLEQWQQQSATAEIIDWAGAFDEWVTQALQQQDKTALLNWQTQAPHAQRNHPTPEHFRPLLIAAGAADMQNASFPISGFAAGVLSYRSVQFNA